MIILKCLNSECKNSKRCWRTNAPDAENQRWFMPKITRDKDCNYYFRWDFTTKTE